MQAIQQLKDQPQRDLAAAGLGAAVALCAVACYRCCFGRKKRATLEAPEPPKVVAQSRSAKSFVIPSTSLKSLVAGTDGDRSSAESKEEETPTQAEIKLKESPSKFLKGSAPPSASQSKIAQEDTKSEGPVACGCQCDPPEPWVLMDEVGKYKAQVLAPPPNLSYQPTSPGRVALAVDSRPPSTTPSAYSNGARVLQQDRWHKEPPHFTPRVDYRASIVRPRNLSTQPRFPRGTRPIRGAQYYR